MSTYVPLEVELEIVKRLPVKSLIRFISVCKAWKSRIECSEFVAGYRTQQQHLMVRHEETEEVKFDCFVDDDTFPQQKFAPAVPPILQLLDDSKIIDSSCGLLCLDGYLREPDNSHTEMYVLWNPSIRKSIAVAAPNRVRWPFSHVTGFGVCPHTNDPKLVKITYIEGWNQSESISCIPRQVEVFTLSYGGWKNLSCSNLPRKSISFRCSQATIGQFIYWLAEDRIDHEDFRDPCNLIMSFDMSTEEFKEIDLPDSLTTDVEAGPDLGISRLKESLALVEYDRWKRVCTVWMMEQGDSKAFTKLFTFNASVVWTLGFRKSGEPIIEMPDVSDRTSLAAYVPCLEHIKDLGICGKGDSFSGSSYTESLLLLDHDARCNIKRGAVKR